MMSYPRVFLAERSGGMCYTDGMRLVINTQEWIEEDLQSSGYLNNVVMYEIENYIPEKEVLEGIGILEIIRGRIVISGEKATHIISDPSPTPLPSYTDNFPNEIGIRRSHMSRQTAGLFFNLIKRRAPTSKMDIQKMLTSGILGLEDDDRRY